MDACHRIFLELSNCCNLAHEHVRCPLHGQMGNPTFLPSTIVYDVMSYLREIEWRGLLLYNVYNEPTIDPRLMMFLQECSAACPGVRQGFITNGEYLDQTLVDEFIAAGADRILVTVYSEPDWKRLKDLTGVQFTRSEGLDDRLEWYDRGNQNLIQIGKNQPCWAPISEINISCRGNVRLCCYDWKEEHTFGNLAVQSLDEIVRNHEIWQTYDGLRRGQRTLTLCRGCSSHRGSPPHSESSILDTT